MVDHGVDGRHVQAARGQVGGHQHLQLAAAQVSQHLGAAALAQVAMQRGGRQAGVAQLVCHLLGGMLRGHKHQHTLPAVLRDQLAQQRRAARAVDHHRALLDVRRCSGGRGDCCGAAGCQR
jgi:hypothetical protein